MKPKIIYSHSDKVKSFWSCMCTQIATTDPANQFFKCDVISDVDVRLIFSTKSWIKAMRQLKIRLNLPKFMLPWLSSYFQKWQQCSSFKADIALSFKSLAGVYKWNFAVSNNATSWNLHNANWPLLIRNCCVLALPLNLSFLVISSLNVFWVMQWQLSCAFWTSVSVAPLLVWFHDC